MDYLVATYRDRIAAEGAYVAAEKAGIPLDVVRLVGRGYDGLDDVALWDKDVAAWKQIRMLLLWLLPFGFVAGTAFNLITRIGMISPLIDPVIGVFWGWARLRWVPFLSVVVWVSQPTVGLRCDNASKRVNICS
ncbi:MAG: hypothetical protein HC926_04490 [Synechococcaceae cyanobacterium SM2_3_60]|nr:hypothetical protein [Synechococcaceae cyanobacterium SM2_3_60]